MEGCFDLEMVQYHDIERKVHFDLDLRSDLDLRRDHEGEGI